MGKRSASVTSPSFTSSVIRHFPLFVIVLLFLFFFLPRGAGAYILGKVVDSITKKPIEGALVTSGGEVERTDAKGVFFKKTANTRIAVRAPGYLRAERTLVVSDEINLVPFTPKALYLSIYGIGFKVLREPALNMIRETELNALVIDIKGDRALIPYKSSVGLAAEIGAQKIITIKDLPALMKSLKEKGIYTIARIVVFKDNLLAAARPDLAVKNQGGGLWRDREHLAWVDPFKKEVWDYNIQIAVEAAQMGFDEIQFDYVRFPDASAPRFSQANTQENRVRAISGFLEEARKRLVPYNVFLAADIFGYVCWNLDDTQIGQRLDSIFPHVDYLSPMLYPSGFMYGIPGYRNPVAHPHEIVYLTLKRAQERTKLPPSRFRPWLQAFRDYAFDRRVFNAKEVRDQITAVSKFGSQGWMLWNPRNVYSCTEALKKDVPPSRMEALSPEAKPSRNL